MADGLNAGRDEYDDRADDAEIARPNRARRLLLWLAGAHSEILAAFPADRAKYIGIGGAVLMTSTMAALSFAFAIHMALGLPGIVCLILGVAWGMAIMSLDRWLMVSMQRREKPWQNLPIALPRIALAVLIGIVISTPLVLRIFQPEIDAELVDLHRERVAAFQQAQITDDRGQQLARLRDQQASLTKTVNDGGASGADVEKDPEVVRLQKQYNDVDGQYRQAEQAVVCEKEGTCGSGKIGAGIAYDEKVRIRDQLANQRAGVAAQLASARAAAATRLGHTEAATAASAKVQLDQVNQQIKTITDGQAGDLDNFIRENNNDTGLLVRIEALDRLTARRPSLGTAHTVLLLFITAIECLPILVKFFMLFGPPTKYEEAVALDESVRLDTEQEAIRRRRTIKMLRGNRALHREQAETEREDQLLEMEIDADRDRLAAELERIKDLPPSRRARKLKTLFDETASTGSRPRNGRSAPRRVPPAGARSPSWLHALRDFAAGRDGVVPEYGDGGSAHAPPRPSAEPTGEQGPFWGRGPADDSGSDQRWR